MSELKINRIVAYRERRDEGEDYFPNHCQQRSP